MSTNVIQITDQQAMAIGRALATVPTIALEGTAVLRTGTDKDHEAVPVLDLDALVKTIAHFGEYIGRTLHAHEATATELRELRAVQHSIQMFLGTYPAPSRDSEA
ncbi:hypothetical protein D2E64_18200 [Mycobacteroides abscessus]|uniref:hypothetical protein n=1 Tax=Mycobacteroides abscessus TaxID=36809 RepID=UPI0002DA923D|nr:hypothetical protein [Mycobacteroides abscessus]MBN7567140.1 hypothetical protein [Mycobacteroides abscessus subsp. massiliense]PVA72262.1 hypothetical protein DDJ76_22945 [Mycobacteroides abscessus]RIS03934.1 hypothetical protein D2E63_22565 [Mycobacteroides abscessus]RIS11309.1 hypothetical protein D2E69_22245 [Mycobacteroides abscessus]RIS23586.1 hypothetical protein D2E67_22210 [Mycobacteroides abscessus]